MSDIALCSTDINIVSQGNELIVQDMSLLQIQDRVNVHHYKAVVEFLRDVDLIVSNFKVFFQSLGSMQ